jgi:hypothetical protein
VIAGRPPLGSFVTAGARFVTISLSLAVQAANIGGTSIHTLHTMLEEGKCEDISV